MKPLPHKTRKILFYALLVVFIIISPFVLAASFGYKITQLDEVFTLVKTGGIYLHSNINNAQIFVDGKYRESAGLLLRNTLIQKLIPGGEHEIVVMKEGYYDWRKTLKVYPSIVTEARVLMLPTEIRKIAVYPFVDGEGNGTIVPPTIIPTVQQSAPLPPSSPSSPPSSNVRPGARPILDPAISVTADGVPIPTNSRYIDLVILFEGENIYDESEKIPSTPSAQSARSASPTPSAQPTPTDLDAPLIADESSVETIPEYFVRLGIDEPDKLNNLIFLGDQVAWLDDGNIFLNWINDEKVPPYYYCLEPDLCRTQIILDWGDDILSFDFLPARDDVFVVLISDGVYAVEVDDRSDRNIQPIYLGENLKFEKNSRNQIVILDNQVFYELSI